MVNGVIVAPNLTLKKASTLDDALANATTWIYIYARGTETASTGRYSNGLLIPVITLTSNGYYFNNTNHKGSISVFIKKNGYSNLNVSWDTAFQDVVTEFYYA